MSYTIEQLEAAVTAAVAQRDRLLREARNFVGKSRCSVGHSTGEVVSRAKDGSCDSCKDQFDLYQRLDQAQLADYKGPELVPA